MHSDGNVLKREGGGGAEEGASKRLLLIGGTQTGLYWVYIKVIGIWFTLIIVNYYKIEFVQVLNAYFCLT